MSRSFSLKRNTAETRIELSIDLDGSGRSTIATGLGFLDHMLTLFARHAMIDLEVTCQGDTHVDGHHSAEDIGICLGQAIDKALGDKKGLTRYGHMTLPMDETLVQVALDLSGRPYFVWKVDFPTPKVGEFDTELVEEFWHAVCIQARMNLHAILIHGRNSHHISEALFKGLARAFRQAWSIDPRETGVPSTKGTLTD
ncbi:imidazoleglycerol-phosphate dehydratase HisB [bacterium]|nr:imidazoleglycerol-phosphate dehydratase HisB [bacterium]